MKYAVDKIEENIVTLENIETKEIETVSKDLLPKKIKEGSIIEKIIKYKLDPKEENKRRKNIRDRFNKLKN